MGIKISIALLLCCATAFAGSKISPLQEIQATEQEEQSTLEKWKFPAVMGATICCLLLWHSRASKSVVATPKSGNTQQPAIKNQNIQAPQSNQPPIDNQPHHNQPAKNPPAPHQKPDISYTSIDAMEVGELYKKVDALYKTKHARQEFTAKFCSPFTEEEKQELCQQDLFTIELPSAWNSNVPEITIVADRRVAGKHSYAIFSRIENARDQQTVKEFFGVVEPA